MQLVATATKMPPTFSNDFKVLAVLERLDSHDNLNSTKGGPRTQIGHVRKAVSELDFSA